MKNLYTFEEFLNEQEDMLNEDSSSLITSLMLLMQSTFMLTLAIQKSRGSGGGDGESIKDWWNRWKKDRRINKVLDRLKDDPEVLTFLALPEREQKGKWQRLIDKKLSAEEKDLLKQISRDRVKDGKI